MVAADDGDAVGADDLAQGVADGEGIFLFHVLHFVDAFGDYRKGRCFKIGSIYL